MNVNESNVELSEKQIETLRSKAQMLDKIVSYSTKKHLDCRYEMGLKSGMKVALDILGIDSDIVEDFGEATPKTLSELRIMKEKGQAAWNKELADAGLL